MPYQPGRGPTFHGLGRKKRYEEGVSKTYHFTEAEKDSWANLFEYKGSHEMSGLGSHR